MEAANTFDYKKFRSQISLQYGVELDETSLAILHILLIQQVNSFNTQNRKLDEAVKHINQSKKSLEVSKEQPKSQAFWFGMGQWGLALLMSVIFIATFYAVYLSIKREKEKLPALFTWYKNYYEATQNGNKKAIADYLKSNPMPPE